MLFTAKFPENQWPEHGAGNQAIDLGLTPPSERVQTMIDEVDELVRAEVRPREQELRSRAAGPYSHLTEDGP